MKIVINECYGGFGLSEAGKKLLGLEDYFAIDRTDERLIKLVEEADVNINGPCAKLKVVEIPDEATDWEFDEYDGYESIIYVLNGEIYHI